MLVPPGSEELDKDANLCMTRTPASRTQGILAPMCTLEQLSLKEIIPELHHRWCGDPRPTIDGMSSQEVLEHALNAGQDKFAGERLRDRLGVQE